MDTHGDFDFSQFTEFVKQIEQLEKNMPEFCEYMAKQLAAELLRKCIKRTPVISGKLKQSWCASAVQEAGENYEITVSNNVLYASYVEYGHRQDPGRYVPAIGKRLVKVWVPGQFMMTISAQEVEQGAEARIQRALEKYMKRVLG